MELTGKIVLGIGQCSFDLLGSLAIYPQLDQKAELDSLVLQGGGPVATALVTLARLGVQTRIISRTGDDYFGRLIRTGLEQEGVDCQYLSTDIGRTSQLAFVTVDQAGHRNIFWHRGSAHPLAPNQITQELFSSAAILHLDGLHMATAIAAARVAREQGVITVLDGGTFRDGIIELLPLIDHLIVSESFACKAVGINLAHSLEELSRWNASAVTITLGQRGSISRLRDGTCFEQPAFQVEVVDTTGCGDVFHGGYIYGLLQDWTLPETVRFAAACSALKTRAVGGRTAIPNLLEVQNLLQKRLFSQSLDPSMSC